MPVFSPSKDQVDHLIREATRRREALGSTLVAINHFRFFDNCFNRRHVSVAVDVLGLCYVGGATCDPRDQYNGKYGYQLSVCRALKKMESGEQPDFGVDSEAMGRDQRAQVEAKIFGEYRKQIWLSNVRGLGGARRG